MRELITKFLYVFYQYYNQGSTKNSAYECAILALVMVLYLNGLALHILIWPEYTSNGLDVPMWMAFILPVFLLLRYVFPKAKVLQVRMTTRARKIAWLIIIPYLVLSMALIVLAAKLQ